MKPVPQVGECWQGYWSAWSAALRAGSISKDHQVLAITTKVYFDSLVHDAAALRYLIELAGVERIALGTDYPFPLGELEPGRLIRSLDDLDAAAKQRLLGGTALEFLGLEAP